MSDADEPEPSPEEIADAERFARALDRDAAPAGALRDEEAAAALLRVARGIQLSDERRAAVRGEVLPARVRRVARRRFLVAGVASAAAAAAAIVAIALIPAHEVSPAPRPGVPAVLLKAQARAAASGAGAVDSLADEMRRYRARLYAALERHYPGVEP